MSFELGFFNFLYGLAGQSKILDWFIIFLAEYLPYFLVILFFLFKGELWQRWRLWFLGGVILMGIARVSAGAHWPLDIVSGFFVAAVSVFVIKWLLSKYSTFTIQAQD